MPASRWRWLAAAGLVGLLTAAAPAAGAHTAEPAGAAPASSVHLSPRAADGWIDGGDDLPCVDDETCLWIEGCKLDGDNNPVYPNHNGTHVGGGSYSYADDTPSATPTPTPTASSSPTKAPSSSPTKAPSASPTKSPTSSSGGTHGQGGSTSSPSTAPTSSAGATEDASDDASEDATEAPAAGTGALSAPTLTATGSDLTVTWAAPGGERIDLVGYTVKVLAGPAEQVDAASTTHTFAALPDGVYAAQVTARYAEGAPETSPVSEKISLGQDPATVVGTVTVTGDVVAGERVTVNGTGFAPGTAGFQVELHSSPVVLASIETDASGAFQVETTVPDTVPAGDHAVVVLYDSVEVASTPVTVAAPAATANTEAASVGSASSSSTRGGLILLAGLVAIGAIVLAGYGVSKRRRGGQQPSSDTVDEGVHPATV